MFVPIALNVTDVPGQILLADSVMLTVGITVGLTVMVTWLLVTVAGEGHTALEVMITVTLSALANVDEVKVVLLVPALTPFTCHW